ncbi:unnamed protein product [Mesocestoides corti]|uniref:G-protein coupled receptors family 1 profile domain-containing protein n=2 Tax=Mesocestoides corti TaxID=53468 RepID=A0A0R3U7Y0_MESCO|nr:unnamed protein product [Mesocestoides corti]
MLLKLTHGSSKLSVIFQVIVHPFHSKRIWNRPLFVLPSLWLLAFLMATPMLAFSTVSTGLTIVKTSTPRLVCIEASLQNPRLQRFKYAYGIFTLLCQYVAPIVILVAVYIRICTRIRQLSSARTKNSQLATVIAGPGVNRMDVLSINDDPHRTFLEVGDLPSRSVSANMPSGQGGDDVMSLASQRRKQQDRIHCHLKRQRRANLLLTCVSLVFVLSWLPLHAVNIIMDYKESSATLAPRNRTLDDAMEGRFMGARHITLIQSFCLLCVLFSCCVNPLLYGYLNENYRKEILETVLCCCCCRVKMTHRQRSRRRHN